ncbi:uncharacterized protein LOC128543284 [Clarias gariepinus]|uniref:uncharacterized protein LOC128543284 n=1 Tax=Clarias gariepinus TaxID=13013 RepID=UPI00234CA165|nr:uncharacterized protein LOC128543284 [Clarias gariepinus]
MCFRMSLSPTHSPTDSGSAPNYKRSRSCGTPIDIDSRIARAMDLVTFHMLSAVREEVEPLKEKIKSLTERNTELKRENHLLRSLTKTGQEKSYEITNLPTHSLDQLMEHQTSLTSYQVTNHKTALTSGQITNHQRALTCGQIGNHQTAMTSYLNTNQQTAPFFDQIAKHQTALTSGWIAAYQRVPNQNHHCYQHFESIPERSENFSYRSVDYPDNGCFTVNTQQYLSVAIKHNVRCA